MNSATTIRQARRESGLSQNELARLAGRSQATISAYESGAKEPSLSTMERLLAATGHRLEVHQSSRTRQPSRREVQKRGRILAQVLELAEALPARRRPGLDYPRLPTLASR